MNRGLPSLIAGSLLVVVLGLYMVTYQVRFTQVAVRKTFGKVTQPDAQGASPDVITEPGLKWKWPWPIQSVDVYDKRIQVVEAPGEETPTSDKKPIILRTALGWRIKDPYVFNRSCGSMKDAEPKLITILRDTQKTVVGGHTFPNFVSADPKMLKYDEIEKEILDGVKARAVEMFGIEVTSVNIEKLALPSRITETVFDAMKKERQTQVAKYTSEGDSKAATIKATANSIADTILAFADRKAAEIVSEGLRRANKYNEVFRKDQDLAMFLLKIENLPKILKEKSTTMVFDQNSPLLDLLFEGVRPGPTTRPANAPQVAQNENVAPPEMVRPGR